MADINATLQEGVRVTSGGLAQAAIRVQDTLQVDPLTGAYDVNLTEGIKSADALDSWAEFGVEQIGTRERGVIHRIGPIRVTDTLTVDPLGGAYAVLLTEQVLGRDADDSWVELGAFEGVGVRERGFTQMVGPIKVRDLLSPPPVMGPPGGGAGTLQAVVQERIKPRAALVDINAGQTLPVRLQAFSLDAGLGGTIRDVLVSQEFTAGCWPLGELQSTLARDITGLRNHGTYTGSGFTRGLICDTAEGNLATGFEGTGYIVVPDDGQVAGRNLSLAGGSVDICFLIKTTWIDGTERAIVAKRGGLFEGYYVGMISGAIRFIINVGGSNLFNFTRGFIADGAWHEVHCFYDPPIQEARIYIDGVQAGFGISTFNIDPVYTTAELRIGSDPIAGGASNFIGALAFVMVGREGNPNLAAAIHAARAWTSLTDSGDVRAADRIECSYGIASSNLWDLVASTGTLNFTLDNSENNSGQTIGYYSIGHPNCRAGFDIGIPLRLTLTYNGVTYYKFRGRVVSARPVAGVHRTRAVLVTGVDWMDVAARSYYGDAPAQIGQRSDVVLGMVIDQASSSPPAVSIPQGAQTFSYALDAGQAEREPVLTEMARIAPSEFGYLFQKGDTNQGGVLTFVPRFARQASAAIAWTITDTMTELEAEMATDDVVNVVKGTIHPPTIDVAATTVLYSLLCDATNTHVVHPGETVTIDGPYSDPNDRPTHAGGTAMVTPVATTDYTANTSATGSGTDMTSVMLVDAALGATMIRAHVSNTGSVPFYITKLQVRGKGIYRYVDTPVEVRDDNSVRQFGERSISIDMPYQGSTTAASSIVHEILDRYTEPQMRAKSVTFFANRNATHLTQALAREVGDRVAVAETATGLTESDGNYINAVHLTIREGNWMQCQWTLAPSWPATLLVSYTGPINDTHDFAGGDLVLSAPGTYTFVFNRLGDTIRVSGVAGGGGGGAGTADSINNAGGGGGAAGTSNLTGVLTLISATTYNGRVAAGGLGAQTAGTAGTAGGITDFRIPQSTIVLQLPGGNPGSGAAGALAGQGGTSGGAGIGIGNIQGTSGGKGGEFDTLGHDGFPGGDSGTGAAGGGGGGDSGRQGGRGGNSADQSGGTAGNGANGSPGSAGTNNGGTGGGGGGGLLVENGYYGGGGGGGAGDQGNPGAGGNGAQGVLRITKV